MAGDILEYLRNQIDIHVRAGFGSEARVMRRIEEQVRDELLKTDGSDVAPLLAYARAQLGQQRELEETWTHMTQNDRIDHAFAELRWRGIVALQDAGYTMSDGWEDVAEARREVPGAWGATFFHRQDVERAVAGGGLMLAYGAFARGDEHESESLRLAREVCSMLDKHGVATEWDGTLKRRISIPPFDWQKRRWTSPPADAPLVPAALIGPEQIAQLWPSIAEVFQASSDGDWCATFSVVDSPDDWIQVTRKELNFAYSGESDPTPRVQDLARRSSFELQLAGWEAGKYITLSYHPGLTPRDVAAVAGLIFITFFQRTEYDLDVELMPLD